MRTISIVTAVWMTFVPSARLMVSWVEAGDAGQREKLNPSNSIANVRWPAPVLTDGNLTEWLTFIRPTAEELKWRNIRWHTSLASAVEEARRLQRPILLWTMNGNPCGET